MTYFYRYKKKGFSLMEMMLVLGAFAAIVAIGFWIYSIASERQKVSAANSQLTSIQKAISDMSGVYSNIDEAKNMLLQSKVLPSNMVNGSNLVNPWKGKITITSRNGSDKFYDISYYNVPSSSCIDLVNKSRTVYKTVGSSNETLSSTHNVSDVANFCSGINKNDAIVFSNFYEGDTVYEASVSTSTGASSSISLSSSISSSLSTSSSISTSISASTSASTSASLSSSTSTSISNSNSIASVSASNSLSTSTSASISVSSSISTSASVSASASTSASLSNAISASVSASASTSASLSSSISASTSASSSSSVSTSTSISNSISSSISTSIEDSKGAAKTYTDEEILVFLKDSYKLVTVSGKPQLEFTLKDGTKYIVKMFSTIPQAYLPENKSRFLLDQYTPQYLFNRLNSTYSMVMSVKPINVSAFHGIFTQANIEPIYQAIVDSYTK